MHFNRIATNSKGKTTQSRSCKLLKHVKKAYQGIGTPECKGVRKSTFEPVWLASFGTLPITSGLFSNILVLSPAITLSEKPQRGGGEIFNVLQVFTSTLPSAFSHPSRRVLAQISHIAKSSAIMLCTVVLFHWKQIRPPTF